MPDENSNTETGITSWQKLLAGVLLVAFTFIVIYNVIAYWPDKMPPLEKGDNVAWYTNKPFHIDLIENPCDTDIAMIHTKDSLHKILDSVEKEIAHLKNNLNIDSTKVDSLALGDSLKKYNDSAIQLKALVLKLKSSSDKIEEDDRIHLNTILLILVALMGFLGNMVHIASSFTAFVGNGTFKRRWILWYFVKPFTAAALAIIVYFIIRAGFLSYGTGAAGISLYGILSLSALTGLFTDSATLKLGEIFDVIFKPKDERQDKLLEPDISVISISPLSIPQAGESLITLKGKNFEARGIKITVDGKDVKATITKDTIEIKYTPTPAAIAAAKAVLVLTDKFDEPKFTKEIIITP
ncbi:MAG: IPT/TIG domain-containing protein [Ginsengibacter sp.]